MIVQHTRARTRSAVAAAAMLGTLLAGAAVPAGAAVGTQKATGQEKAQEARSTTFALFGDTPYGSAQVAAFPETMQKVTGYPGLSYAVHVGDIKAGSARCDTSYFQWVKTQFETSRVPLVYTPGDNEWTDCHRTNNGAYNPLDRLAALRQVMYTDSNGMGAGSLPLKTQAAAGLPENAEWETKKVEFAAVNVQGSHNGLDPWTGLGQTAPTEAQLAEFRAREAANISLIRQQFADAQRRGGAAVVIVMQADMFDGYLANDSAAARAAFGGVLGAIAEGARSTGKPVYILNGDSHSFKDEHPLAAGSPWLEVYGLAAAPNVRQITVEGAANSHEFTLVTVNSHVDVRRGAEPLTFKRVQY